jgi:hypothetical protein
LIEKGWGIWRVDGKDERKKVLIQIPYVILCLV